MLFFGSFIGALLLVGLVYIQLDTFGGRFTSKVKARLNKSPHYSNGKFQNLEHTPSFAKGVNMWTLFISQFKEKNPHLRPSKPIQTQAIDWENIPDNTVVWLGHSSLFLRLNGLNILMDPVKTVYAAPMKGVNKSFPMEPGWEVADIPKLDYIFISHDHYDHLDRQTIKALKHHNATFICGLGVSVHLKRWGVPVSKVIELDWWDTYDITPDFKLHFIPTRHFSGRKWNRNNTLWGSFMLEMNDQTIYLGADSGYGNHFKTIAEKFQKIDWAFLEMGQYNAFWPYIHMPPEDFEKAVMDLNPQHVIPIHHSGFSLSDHAWNTPQQLIYDRSKGWQQHDLYLPEIGEVVHFQKSTPSQKEWWNNI